MRSYVDYTVAIVCALEFEMSAIRYMLDEEHQRLPRTAGDSNNYILGQLSGHTTVIACLPGTQGKSAAAIVASNLERTFPCIAWRFLVGIGGGAPDDNDIRLGDVVVSMPEGRHGGVVQYDLGKDLDGSFQLKGFLCAPSPELRSAVLRMRSDHRLEDNKIEQYISSMLERGRRLRVYQRPVPAMDVLFASNYQHVPSKKGTCENCDQEHHAIKRPDREDMGSMVHYGLIASGDRVMRSAIKRNSEVQNLGDNILCFEMEAAGLSTNLPYLVIRGIADYADSHKNDAWQHYAAAAAAAYTKEVLTYLDQGVPGRGNDSDDKPNGPRRSARFKGNGIQHLGSGTFSVGRDIRIGR
ncbi:nucleoside phosphorylase domain-containing protein [Xylariaceae sp. FL1272]|nr:nucleoside phosphorylase domain-containing protein [Xylariaceae sp. FL1272]